jgi:hypothetical protein
LLLAVDPTATSTLHRGVWACARRRRRSPPPQTRSISPQTKPSQRQCRWHLMTRMSLCIALAGTFMRQEFEFSVVARPHLLCLQRVSTHRQPSYGNMVGCENDNCEIEWFHYACVGLKSEVGSTWTSYQRCSVVSSNCILFHDFFLLTHSLRRTINGTVLIAPRTCEFRNYIKQCTSSGDGCANIPGS